MNNQQLVRILIDYGYDNLQLGNNELFCRHEKNFSLIIQRADIDDIMGKPLLQFILMHDYEQQKPLLLLAVSADLFLVESRATMGLLASAMREFPKQIETREAVTE